MLLRDGIDLKLYILLLINMVVKKSEIKVNNSWPSVFKQDTIVFDSPIKEYKPWVNAEKINADLSIRGNIWWAWKTLYFELNENTTWIRAYEWFWFTPSSYVITAWLQWNNNYGANSYWTYIDWQTKSFYMRKRQDSVTWDINTGQFQSSTDIIHIYDDADLSSVCSHSWFTNDGIELNWTLASIDVNFTITAYP